MSLHQAAVLYYKVSDRNSKPSEKCYVDLKITQGEHKDLTAFKKRLLRCEGLIERSQLSFSKFSIRVGYCQKSPSRQGGPPVLGVFVESVSDEQFEICMQKVATDPSLHQLTVKVEEEMNPFFSKSQNSQKPQARNESCEVEITHVTSAPSTSALPKASTSLHAPASSTFSSLIRKRGVKRSHTQSDEDSALWSDLRNGADVVRNERQQLRLEKWKSSVAESNSEQYEAIDERNIKCALCKSWFTVNKFNALGDLGKNHKKCTGKSSKKHKQTKLSFA